jgi:hypothetical protein
MPEPALDGVVALDDAEPEEFAAVFISGLMIASTDCGFGNVGPT